MRLKREKKVALKTTCLPAWPVGGGDSTMLALRKSNNLSASFLIWWQPTKTILKKLKALEWALRMEQVTQVDHEDFFFKKQKNFKGALFEVVAKTNNAITFRILWGVVSLHLHSSSWELGFQTKARTSITRCYHFKWQVSFCSLWASVLWIHNII